MIRFIVGIVAVILGALVFAGVSALGGLEDPGFAALGLVLGVLTGLVAYAKL